MEQYHDNTTVIKKILKTSFIRLTLTVLIISSGLVCAGLFLLNGRLKSLSAGISVTDMLINLLIFALIMTAVLIYGSSIILSHTKAGEPEAPSKDKTAGKAA